MWLPGLKSIAQPGGIAQSGTVRDHLGTRLDLHFEDSASRSLKNIERLVRVLVLDNAGLSTRTIQRSAPLISHR